MRPTARLFLLAPEVVSKRKRPKELYRHWTGPCQCSRLPPDWLLYETYKPLLVCTVSLCEFKKDFHHWLILSNH